MFRLLTIACSFAVLSTSACFAGSDSKTATSAQTPAEHHTPPKQVTSLDSLKNKPKTTLKVARTDMVMYVGNLHCQHCAKSLTSKLFTVKGVKSVRADIKADVAVITPQTKKNIDAKALFTAAQKSGFPAIKLVGPTGTYVVDAKTKQPMLMKKQPVAPKAEITEPAVEMSKG